jgi:hypothetical protein
VKERYSSGNFWREVYGCNATAMETPWPENKRKEAPLFWPNFRERIILTNVEDEARPNCPSCNWDKYVEFSKWQDYINGGYSPRPSLAAALITTLAVAVTMLL